MRQGRNGPELVPIAKRQASPREQGPGGGRRGGCARSARPLTNRYVYVSPCILHDRSRTHAPMHPFRLQAAQAMLATPRSRGGAGLLLPACCRGG